MCAEVCALTCICRHRGKHASKFQNFTAMETEDMSFWIDDIKKLLGITVIMVEHNMNLVSQVSDHVLAINYGEALAYGSPRDVQENPDVIKAYLGENQDA